ncbi:MAG: TadE/TadG family type IV pilus assembly protein [Hyphomicrobiaceae bacterium]|nr:TadE/TadG family type IV pilus assembly protein [Hyphomicrobiaceae bacterium]
MNFSRTWTWAGRLRRDEGGAALVLATVFMLTLLSVVAVAVDYGQATVLKQKLQNAADAAALAVGGRLNLTQEQANALANNYIKANYPDLAIGTLTSFTVTPTANGYKVQVTASLPTTFLRVLGTDTLNVGASSEVSRQLKKLEVVMALDNTGSMSTNDRIGKLKTAANTLVDTLFGEDDVSDYVKIGLVPFSAAVNLGAGALGKGWIDETGASSLNREDITLAPGKPSLFDVYRSMNNVAWGGCVRARTNGYDLTDDPPNLAVPATLFVPYFAPDEEGNAGAYTYQNTYINGEATTAGQYTGKGLTAAMIADGNGPGWNCVPRPVQALTNVRSTISDAITAMQPRGSTVIPEGLGWAWRVVSPGLPFDEGAAYSDKTTTKAIILLTDGRNQVENTGTKYKSFYSAYGFANKGHLGATDGSQSRQVLNAKTTTLCNSIKADKDGDPTTDDIYIYTIALEISTGNSGIDNETKSLLQSCATPAAKCPGGQCFFDTPSGDALQEVFSKIALGLASLRVAK